MRSASEENYIKAIYHLEKVKGRVNTNTLATHMNAKASSITDMVKKLAQKNVVDYEPYQGAALTHKGEEVALSVIRKHRLWEFFLVEKLNFPWDEVHQIAEQLEHIHSDKLIEALDEFLGYPTHDPHGDPIPNSQGEMPSQERTLLNELKQGDTFRIVGLVSTKKDFLKFLDRKQLAIGQVWTLSDKDSYDGTIQLLSEDQNLQLTQKVSEQIYTIRI